MNSKSVLSVGDFPEVNLELWSMWFQCSLELLFPELTESVFCYERKHTGS